MWIRFSSHALTIHFLLHCLLVARSSEAAAAVQLQQYHQIRLQLLRHQLQWHRRRFSPHGVLHRRPHLQLHQGRRQLGLMTLGFQLWHLLRLLLLLQLVHPEIYWTSNRLPCFATWLLALFVPTCLPSHLPHTYLLTFLPTYVITYLLLFYNRNTYYSLLSIVSFSTQS